MENNLLKKSPLRHLIQLKHIITLLIILGCLYCTFAYLENIPGINGDEPENAIQVIKTHSLFMWAQTHRILSPLYIIQTWITHLFLDNSLFAMRITPAIAGAIGIFLSLFCFTRMFTFSAGLGIAFLSCALPLHIGYSRISWEICHIFPVIVVVVFFAQQKKWISTWISFNLLIIVHLTGIFLAPAVFLGRCLEILKTLKQRQVKLLKPYIPDIIGFVAVLYSYRVQRHGGVRTISGLNPHDFMQHLNEYIFGFARLINGASIYDYMTGGMSYLVAEKLNIITLVLFVILAITALKLSKKESFERTFIQGFLISLVAFWVIDGGDNPLYYGNSRFAVWMGIPTAVIFGLGLQNIQNYVTKIKYPFLSAILAFVLLYQFNTYFFQATLAHGKLLNEATFWTGPKEPKFAACEFLESQRIIPKQILTDEYWIEQPTIYYFMKKPSYKVFKYDIQTTSIENLVQKIKDGDALIVFANRETDKKLQNNVEAKTLLRTTFLSYDNQETVAAWTHK